MNSSKYLLKFKKTVYTFHLSLIFQIFNINFSHNGFCIHFLKGNYSKILKCL